MALYPAFAPVSEGKVKDALSMGASTADDDLLFDLCAGATKLIEEQVGPIIERAPITVYAKGDRHLAILDEHERPGNLDAAAAQVAEYGGGTTWDDMVLDTDFFAPFARGSSSVLAGRFERITPSRHRDRWPSGLRTIRVTDWTPGRFATTAALDDSAEGASLAQAYLMTVKHLWVAWTTQGTAIDSEYDTVRPVWPGFGLPNVAKDLLKEHMAAESMMAGFWGS